MIDISLDKAKTEKLFYFVMTGTIFHAKKKKCLILQRSFKEKAHPGLWGVVGGKLEWKDMLENEPTRQNFDIKDWEGLCEELLKREAFEESGLEVGDFHYLDSVVFLRPDNVPVVCFKFAVKYLSGEVRMAEEFEDFAWVDGEEVKKYKCIEGIHNEVAKTIDIFSSK